MRAERQRASGEERAEVAKRLDELQAAFAAEIREWSASIDAWKKEGYDVG